MIKIVHLVEIQVKACHPKWFALKEKMASKPPNLQIAETHS
jgi:hypothetical protein